VREILKTFLNGKGMLKRRARLIRGERKKASRYL